MCGIAGIHFKRLRVLEQKKIENIVDLLLLGIESRGKDATGFVAVTGSGKSLVMEKQPVRASIFIYSRPEIPKRPRTILLHTRWATQGWPTNPDNNHPVVHGDTYVTHNGHIDNDSKLFESEAIERLAEVDSEIIAAMIDKHGFDKINLALRELDGGFAIAAINPVKHPDNLILAKGPTSPLYIYENDDFVMWASERRPIEKTCEDVLDFKPPWDDVKFLEQGNMVWVSDKGTDVLAFPTYDDVYKPKPKYYEHGYGWNTQGAKDDDTNSCNPQQRREGDSGTGFICKGCKHGLAMHPGRKHTQGEDTCIGSDKCNCRKYVSHLRVARYDDGEIVAYVGVEVEGVKRRCGVRPNGELVDVITGEVVQWPSEAEEYLDEVMCVCEHNQFFHVGMINGCNAKGCDCVTFLENKQVEASEVIEQEDLSGVEMQCDGCEIWMGEDLVFGCDGAALCINCKREWEAAADQEGKQWLDLAETENDSHQYCLKTVSGKTGLSTEFIDWLLFRCPTELMDGEGFLQNAREVCDEAYGDAEDEFFHSNAMEMANRAH